MKVSTLKDLGPLIIQHILRLLLPLGHLIGLRFVQMSSKNSYPGKLLLYFWLFTQSLKIHTPCPTWIPLLITDSFAENQVCGEIPREAEHWDRSERVVSRHRVPQRRHQVRGMEPALLPRNLRLESYFFFLWMLLQRLLTKASRSFVWGFQRDSSLPTCSPRWQKEKVMSPACPPSSCGHLMALSWEHEAEITVWFVSPAQTLLGETDTQTRYDAYWSNELCDLQQILICPSLSFLILKRRRRCC